MAPKCVRGCVRACGHHRLRDPIWTTYTRRGRRSGPCPEPSGWGRGRASGPADDLRPRTARPGDRRNVVDPYRYWRRDAIVADLDEAGTRCTWRSRTSGTTTTSARSCARPTRSPSPACTSSDGGGGTAAGRWSPTATAPCTTTTPSTTSRPSPTRTDRGRRSRQHPRCRAVETATLPRECVLLFGQEGPGLTDAARAAAGLTVSIAQFGSTRSMNAGVAAGIAMHAWIRAHADCPPRGDARRATRRDARIEPT